jgi:serine/threonine protein kinase
MSDAAGESILGFPAGISGRWRLIRTLTSGNQGLVFEAVGDGGVRGFVKVFPSNASSERRARFKREAATLRRLDVTGIPRLLETNVDTDEPTDDPFYLVTEFVDGVRLADAVHDGLSADEAVDTTTRLCDIVRQVHESGIIHRDIKPDNVMVRRIDGRMTDVFLVDFGIVHDVSTDDFRTRAGNEMGNRFLRLPEHASGQLGKDDHRSDVTFCVGILYYMLVRKNPSVLLDAEGRHPHQRPQALPLIRASNLDFNRLMLLFDIGFALELGKRYQTVTAFVDDLSRLKSPAQTASEAEHAENALRERYTANPQVARQQAAAASRHLVVNIVGVALRDIVAELRGALQLHEPMFSAQPDSYNGVFTVSDPFDSLKHYDVTARATVVGTEHVLTVTGNGETYVLRIPVDRPLTEEYSDILRTYFIVGINRATDNQRFHTPRDLEPSPWMWNSEFQPGDRFEFEEEHAHRFRPTINIIWYPPRTEGSTIRIAWDLKNVGYGPALDVRMHLPYLAKESWERLAVGDVARFDIRFDDRKAYYNFSQGTFQAIVECTDVQGNFYRQSANGSTCPTYNGSEADYMTTQFGDPFLVRARIAKPNDAGTDPLYADGPDVRMSSLEIPFGG